MALPNDVRNLRKYLLAAQRELDSIKLREEFRMDVDGITDGLNRAWSWTEEYTWSLQNEAGTSVIDSESDSRPASEAEGSVDERGTPWFFSM